jgi:hypothetical protein
MGARKRLACASFARLVAALCAELGRARREVVIAVAGLGGGGPGFIRHWHLLAFKGIPYIEIETANRLPA